LIVPSSSRTGRYCAVFVEANDGLGIPLVLAHAILRSDRLPRPHVSLSFVNGLSKTPRRLVFRRHCRSEWRRRPGLFPSFSLRLHYYGGRPIALVDFPLMLFGLFLNPPLSSPFPLLLVSIDSILPCFFHFIPGLEDFIGSTFLPSFFPRRVTFRFLSSISTSNLLRCVRRP